MNDHEKSGATTPDGTAPDSTAVDGTAVDGTAPVGPEASQAAHESPTEPILSIRTPHLGGTPHGPGVPLTKAEPYPATAPAPVPAPASAPVGPSRTTPSAEPASRGPRVGTVVWGFIILALGTAVLAVSLGADVDFALVAIGVLGLAGLTLVVGSVASASRRRAV